MKKMLIRKFPIYTALSKIAKIMKKVVQTNYTFTSMLSKQPILPSIPNYLGETGRIITRMNQLISPNLETTLWYLELYKLTEEEEYKTFEFNWLGYVKAGTAIKLYILHKQGKAKEIWDTLKNIFRNEDNVERLIMDFEESEIFKPRMEIIKDALQAHLEEKYTLSVPVLLAQVEGIMWDIAEKKGMPKSRKIITKKGKELKIHSATGLLEWPDLGDDFYINFVNYLLTEVYVEDNRHGIMHGRLTTYHTEENSIKAIMMLRELLYYCKKLE